MEPKFPTFAEWLGDELPPDMTPDEFADAMEGTFYKAFYDLHKAAAELKFLLRRLIIEGVRRRLRR